MLIVTQKKLNEFGKRHADARKSLATWTCVTEEAIWRNKQDVLHDLPNAKMIQKQSCPF
jgi:mRNA interferase HigB